MKTLNILKNNRQNLINNLIENIESLEKIAYEQQAEIERLQGLLKEWKKAGYKYADSIDLIKAEAIKEFADEFVKHLGEEIAECGEVDPNTTPLAYGTVLGLRSAMGYVEAIVMVGDDNA